MLAFTLRSDFALFYALKIIHDPFRGSLLKIELVTVTVRMLEFALCWLLEGVCDGFMVS